MYSKFFFFRISSSETIKIAQEIQADFNGQYPTTLSNYKGWKTEESNYGYTAIKKINSEITDTLMYKAINNGESFELAFTHSVDIYRFRPVNGQIQRL